MTDPIAIRYATAADSELLAEIGAQTFFDAFARDNTPEDMRAYLAASFSPEKQARELAEPRSVFLIAEIAGRAAGYAHLRQMPPPACIIGAHPHRNWTAVPVSGMDRTRRRHGIDARVPRSRRAAECRYALARRLGAQPARHRVLSSVGICSSRHANFSTWQ